MKKLLIFIGIMLSITSCSQSPEDKANALIEEALKKVLYHADSYDPVETIVDSAFTPFDDPEFYNLTLSLCKLGDDIDDYERQAKNEEREIAHYQDLLRILYSNSDKVRLNQAQENYNNYVTKKKEAEEKIKKIAEQLKADIQQKPLFIGFKVRHRYRAKNNEGQTVFGEELFLFNKEITQIIHVWEPEEYEYKQVQSAYKYMRGEN